MENKALIVGVNVYSGDPNARLAGCCNDARSNVNNIASDRFDKDGWNVKILIDERATVEAHKDALDWLTSGNKPGQKLLYCDSSHGTYWIKRDSSGNAIGIEHAIVCTNLDWNALDYNCITGTYLQQKFSGIIGDLTIISDSCNSGGLLGGTKALHKNETVYTKSRLLHPPPDIQLEVGYFQKRGMKPHPRGIIGDVAVCQYMSGCGSSQDDTSADTTDENGVPCGAFTHALWGVINTMPPETIFSDLTNAVIAKLAAAGYEQKPTCYGSRINLPFLG